MRLLLVIVVLACAADARADELERARQLKQTLDYDGALAATQRAISGGGNDRATLVEAYRLAGELAAGLGRDDEATTYFQRLLALEPATRLPEGTSPKTVAPFDRARDNLAGRRLAAHHERSRAGLVVVVDEDPLGMVAAARAGNLRVDGAGRFDVPLPEGGGVVELIDRHGNVLWSISAPAVLAPLDTKVARPPAWQRFELWGLATLGLVGAGVYTAVELDQAQDEWDRLRADDGAHDFSELRRVEQRGRSFALTTNLMLGAAAITGTVSVICLVRELRRPDVDDTVTVTGALTRGGGVLGIAGRF